MLSSLAAAVEGAVSIGEVLGCRIGSPEEAVDEGTPGHEAILRLGESASKRSARRTSNVSGVCLRSNRTPRKSSFQDATGCDTRECHPRAVPSRSSQLAFDLRAPPRWGGRREGAGRPRGPSPRDPHRRRPRLAARFPCHVTLRVRRGIPSLRKAILVYAFKQSLRQVCRRRRFRVVHYSLQRDHAHLLVEASSARDLACGMKAIGARLARAVQRSFRRTGPVLADRFHLRVLRTPCEVRNALAYVLLNSRKHWRERHRALPPVVLDAASSGRWFDGWRLVPGSREPPSEAWESPEVRSARTWLLTIGWRRHGLVDPAEVPGI